MEQIGAKLWRMIEKLANWFLRLVFKIMHMEMTEEIEEGFLEFVKFGIVGVSNTVVSYVIYLAALLGFRKAGIFLRLDYLLAQVVAFVLSVLWSYYWNNKMVFTLKEGEERSFLYSLLKTYVSYAFTGLFLNSILLILWVRVFHISEFLGPVINLIVSVPINFIINKFWAFKKTPQDENNI